jgi:predicted RecA/RadA family phage recombinase
LTGEHDAEVDLAAAHADSAAGRDGQSSVVEGVFELPNARA